MGENEGMQVPVAAPNTDAKLERLIESVNELRIEQRGQMTQLVNALTNKTPEGYVPMSTMLTVVKCICFVFGAIVLRDVPGQVLGFLSHLLHVGPI